MSPHCHLHSLIFQHGSAAHASSVFIWQLLKQLIVLCKELDLASEVPAYTLMPLPCNLFACGDLSNSFDMEHGEIPKDCQLVKMGGCFMLLMSLHPV